MWSFGNRRALNRGLRGLIVEEGALVPTVSRVHTLLGQMYFVYFSSK